MYSLDAILEDDVSDLDLKDLKDLSDNVAGMWEARVEWDEVDRGWAAFFTLDGKDYGMTRTVESEEKARKIAKNWLAKFNQKQIVHPFNPVHQSVWLWYDYFQEAQEEADDSDLKELDTAPVIHWETATVKGRGKTPNRTYVYAQLPDQTCGENVGVIHQYAPDKFVVQYTRKRGIHSLKQHIAFPTLQAAVHAVMADHTGARDLFATHDMMTKASRVLGEMLDDDELSTKEYNYDPVAQARWVLEDAGFKVEEARREGDEMIIRFTWPTPTASAYINGAKRAFEALAPFVKLRQSHYRGHRTGQTAEILIRKRIEEDPNLWKVIPAFGGHYDVVYNGQKVGNFWTESDEEAAHRVREEMSFLSQTTPFNPSGDYGPGNVYGTGPALGWWRKNRHLLSPEQRVGEYYLDRHLMAPPQPGAA
jgi:hypothetical protein